MDLVECLNELYFRFMESQDLGQDRDGNVAMVTDIMGQLTYQ